ncbi:MAG: TerB N-terminal domain-containing protein, partial [Kiritimatiellae bacterium]|nr:TerB N-terminal domain-containing protein [Kiritimatiellia bacterium]
MQYSPRNQVAIKERADHGGVIRLIIFVLFLLFCGILTKAAQTESINHPTASAPSKSSTPLIVGMIVLVVIVITSVRGMKKRGGRQVTLPAKPQYDSRPKVTFQFSTPRNATARLEWKGAGTTIRIGKYVITDPLTYVSDGAPAENEASCINLKLPVGRPVLESRGALGYWPEYAGISPDQRANYLSWLSTGRKEQLDDVGYAFLYFYGLERRALVDNEDIEAILTQANRLMFYYSASRSFFGYSSRFLAFVLARIGLDNLPRESFDIIFQQTLKEFDEETLAVSLAWLQHANAPLPSFLAYEVAKNDIRSSRSIVVTRIADHFRFLFNKKYESQFGVGMTLKVAARDKLIEYKPASSTLLTLKSRGFINGIRIPNVLGLSSQFKPLVDIWEECIEELKPLSREIGKGKDVDTREAYQALPEALKAEVDHPDKDKWEQFVLQNTTENNIVITRTSEIAKLCDVAERPKLTLKQSEERATTAHDVG